METLNEIPGGIWTLAAAFITAVSTVAVAITPRWMEARDRVRARYASSTATLAEWMELPYRISRRTSDDSNTLHGVAELAHDLQEGTARVRAELAADHGLLGALYGEVLSLVRQRAGEAATAAWKQPPITSAGDMNVGSLIVDQVQLEDLVNAWACVGVYRLLPQRIILWLPRRLLLAGEWNRAARLRTLLDVSKGRTR